MGLLNLCIEIMADVVLEIFLFEFLIFLAIHLFEFLKF